MQGHLPTRPRCMRHALKKRLCSRYVFPGRGGVFSSGYFNRAASTCAAPRCDRGGTRLFRKRKAPQDASSSRAGPSACPLSRDKHISYPVGLPIPLQQIYESKRLRQRPPVSLLCRRHQWTSCRQGRGRSTARGHSSARERRTYETTRVYGGMMFCDLQSLNNSFRKSICRSGSPPDTVTPPPDECM